MKVLYSNKMAQIKTFQEKSVLRGPRYDTMILDETMTLGQVIDEAIRLGFPLIVHGGVVGQWYLKAKGRDVVELEERITKSKKTYKNVTSYLISRF